MSNYHNATAEIVFCSVDSFRYICAVDAFGGIFYQLTCFGFISTSKPLGSTWETGNKQTYLHTCNHDIPYETENWTQQCENFCHSHHSYFSTGRCSSLSAFTATSEGSAICLKSTQLQCTFVSSPVL